MPLALGEASDSQTEATTGTCLFRSNDPEGGGLTSPFQLEESVGEVKPGAGLSDLQNVHRVSLGHLPWLKFTVIFRHVTFA